MLTVVQMFSRDTLGVIVTALYCKLMVILGIAFPMAETITDHVPKGFYQIFYVYLFLGSLFFLLFVYIDDLCRQSSARVLSHSRYMNRITDWEIFRGKTVWRTIFRVSMYWHGKPKYDLKAVFETNNIFFCQITLDSKF